MKILLASTSSGSRGGGELYLLYLARALKQWEHEPILWASSHPRMDELAAAFSEIGEVRRSKYQNTYDRPGRSIAAFADRGTARRIAAEWRESGVDILHLNKQNLEDGLDLLHAAKEADLRGLCTIHLTQSARYLKAKGSWLRDWVARRALDAYPAHFVTVLENRRSDLADFLGDGLRIHTIPNGVPLFDLSTRSSLRAATRSELGYNNENLVFVGVGRMVPQKRPIAFLEKAAVIHSSIPAARFLWIGDGALASDWDQWVLQHGMSEVITRLAWKKEVSPYLFAADVFLHMAEFEGLPLAILEALSAGLPCAISRHLLVEMPWLTPANSIAIEEDVSCPKIFLERESLQAMGVAARALAEQEFSLEVLGKRYVDLYQSARSSRT